MGQLEEMTATNQATDRSLLARLVGRLGPYIQDDCLRRSRLLRVLDTLHVDATARIEIELQVLAALAAARIELVVDDEPPSLLPPAERPSQEGDSPDVTHDARSASAFDSPPAAVDWPIESNLGEDAEADEFLTFEEVAPAPEAFECLGTNIDAASAVAAARRRLDLDRFVGSPQRVLLSAEEEVGLALLMRGDRGETSEDLPADFRTSIPDGSEAAKAHDALAVHNILLVWSIAKRFQGQADMFDLEDIVSYGHLGLLRAVRKFDASKGFKFSTYATWWIRQSITRAIHDFGRTIRIPVHMGERINKTRAARMRLYDRNTRPTAARLAAETGFTESEVKQHLLWLRGVYSLDAKVGDDTATLKDFLVDRDEHIDGLYGVERRQLRKEIDAMLAGLSEREARIIRLRFGFADGEIWTLDQIGKSLGRTRERIRQIESKSLTKLRHPSRNYGLRNYVGLPTKDDEPEKAEIGIRDVLFEVATLAPELLRILVARACPERVLSIQPRLTGSAPVSLDLQRLALALCRIGVADELPVALDSGTTFGVLDDRSVEQFLMSGGDWRDATVQVLAHLLRDAEAGSELVSDEPE